MGREHWIDVKLTQIAAPDKFSIVDGPFGSDLKLSDYVEYEGIPVLTTKNISDKWNATGIRYISKEKYIQLKRSQVIPGDILFAKIGSIGKSAIYPSNAPIAIIPANLCKITINETIMPKAFFYYYAISQDFQDKLRSITSATAMPAFSVKKLKEQTAPLPPFNEQKRIVEKLDAILPKVKSAKARLKKIPTILKKFRQSVLAAACSGRLTEDWRERFCNLENIQNNNNDDDIQIYDTPDAWNWKYLNDICDSKRGICYGVIKLGSEEKNGVPCLRTSDVRPLFIDLNNVKRISKEISDNYKRSILKGGEILVNVRGTLGGVAVVSSELTGWNISREVALVPVKDVNPDFYAFVISSHHSQNWLTEVTKGVAYQGINLSDLRLLPVPLPPLEEQHEIVSCVEKLFSLADSLEAKYNKAMERVEKIEQAVLAKAFRGELAEANANDEPADELLRRVLEEKAKLEAGKKKNKISRKKK